MLDLVRKSLVSLLSVALCVFTVYEVNHASLAPLSQRAIFALLGTSLCYLVFPFHPRWKKVGALRVVDMLLAAATAVCCAYLAWEGKEVLNRTAQYTTTDYTVAILGTLLMVEATRRSIGWALPILAGGFLLYAFFGASLPDWLFSHRGYDVQRIASQCFLRTDGVFGVAMGVMFTYVFLFVVFGAFLELSGATQFIVDLANYVFGRSPGGPAKVSVLASGLMGSLSGSAVANAVTTGAFTIPMMRSAGFRPHIAGGIEAATASGGALVPPVMGAGAYMMLEIIDPPVTFLQICKAALIPAILYYLSILLFVHFYSRRIGTREAAGTGTPVRSLWHYEGFVFLAALGTLIGFLVLRYTPFRAVTYSLEVILVLSILSPGMGVPPARRWMALATFLGVTLVWGLLRSRSHDDVHLSAWTTWINAGIPAMLLVLLAGLIDPAWRPKVYEAFVKSARSGVSLVSASACVGIIIGVVNLTGVGTAFPNAIVPLAQESLLLALIAIMVCSIVLGMGLPSAVCYLLMATLIGPVLSRLGVAPLAAHLFIFYFGMMSMVTPPVALAAYATASIAGSKIMATSWAAFRFALVGFTLPYMFIYRPALLLMAPEGETLTVRAVLHALIAAVVGIVALAAGLAGFFQNRLAWWERSAMFVAAALLLTPVTRIASFDIGLSVDIAGAILFGLAAFLNHARGTGLNPVAS
ncbi:MAG: TRAP transporter permease [Pirellulaceae bacterium]